VVNADLAAFLLKRIAEDQERARNARPQDSDPEYPDYDRSSWHEARCGYGMGEYQDECVCAVPARLLAECDSRRLIVEEARDQFAKPGSDPDDGMADLTYGHVLSLLALPYADHPDYDEAWRP
jgi:hypothetical protein